MSITTNWVPVEKVAQLQELVKAHNLRFHGNPFVCGNQALVSVSSEHLPPGAGSAFWVDWLRLTTPIVETVRRPSLMARIRRLFRRW